MSKGRIYIVDDMDEVRAPLVFLLQAEGYSCRAYASGSEFLTELLTLDPGCLLLDYSMPGLTGLEVLSELRWMEIEWPVIMMTGHGNVAVKAMGHGAFDCLEKPFEEDMLMQILDRAFSSGKAAARLPTFPGG
jgi:two-component system, LuxR family, response regulator FixJ